MITGYVVSTPTDSGGYKIVWMDYKTSKTYGRQERIVTDSLTVKLMTIYFGLRKNDNIFFLQNKTGGFLKNIIKAFQNGLAGIMDTNMTIRYFRVVSNTAAKYYFKDNKEGYLDYNREMLHGNDVADDYYFKPRIDHEGFQSALIQAEIANNQLPAATERCCDLIRKWLSAPDNIPLEKKISSFENLFKNPELILNLSVTETAPPLIDVPIDVPIDIPESKLTPSKPCKSRWSFTRGEDRRFYCPICKNSNSFGKGSSLKIHLDRKHPEYKHPEEEEEDYI